MSDKQRKAMFAKSQIQLKKQADPNDIAHVKAKLTNIGLEHGLTLKQERARSKRLRRKVNKDVKEFLANKDKTIGTIKIK